MVARLSIDREALTELCRRHGIRRLALFGSVLRDDFRSGSDVDVLLDFEPEVDRKLTYFKLARVQAQLERLFGRRVEVSLANALDEALRQEILRTSEVQYDAA